MLGDILVLLLFVLLGMRNHELLSRAGALAHLAANVLPLSLAWLLAATALGAWRFPLPLRMTAVLRATLLAWLLAAPLGLLLRALVLGSSTLVVVFMLVTLALGGALLLAWRGLALWLVYGRARSSSGGA